MSIRWRDTIGLLLVAAPALGALMLVLLAGVPNQHGRWLLLAVVMALSIAAAFALRGVPGRGARTLANLVEALREGDYSVRAWSSRERGDHAVLVAGFNRLAAHLQDERRGLQETLQLLSKTLASLDGAVFAFEGDLRLRMLNPAGEHLLGRPAQELLGLSAAQLGLDRLFAVPAGSIHAQAFAGQAGRWQVNHASLRSRSQAGQLLVLQPMERALREEEAQAFRRLLRVLSHEINNSLAPIGSIADTLGRLLAAQPTELDVELREDLRSGLTLIEQRSAALQRFLGGYARLARLPEPVLAVLELAPLCDQVQRLLDDQRLQFEVEDGLWVRADADQLEQVLINLLRNGLEAGGKAQVRLRAAGDGARVRIEIVDAGVGLPASENLFVPFFTTKPNGSGIGLVLSRQILEAQGGALDLQRRTDATGTVAVMTLPAAKPGA